MAEKPKKKQRPYTIAAPGAQKRKPRKDLAPIAIAAACKYCEGPRPMIAVVHGDPYCSTDCAKLDHGQVPEEDLVRVHDRVRSRAARNLEDSSKAAKEAAEEATEEEEVAS